MSRTHFSQEGIAQYERMIPVQNSKISYLSLFRLSWDTQWVMATTHPFKAINQVDSTELFRILQLSGKILERFNDRLLGRFLPD